MKTLPDISLEEHIRQFFTQMLLPYYPSLKQEQLRFTNDVYWDKKTIPPVLMTQEEFLPVFAHIVDEGHDWISLAGSGWFNHHFVVIIEYREERIGFPFTSINLSGPPLINGRPVPMPVGIDDKS